jgi:hypothetical protein
MKENTQNSKWASTAARKKSTGERERTGYLYLSVSIELFSVFSESASSEDSN